MTIRLLTAVLFLLAFPACSLLDKVDRTLTYTNESAAYVQEAVDLTTNLPALAQQAVTDPAAKEQFIAELEQMNERIAGFRQLEAPQLAQEVHDRILAYNAELKTAIDGLLAAVRENVPVLEALNESQVMTVLNRIGGQLEQLKGLTE